MLNTFKIPFEKVNRIVQEQPQAEAAANPRHQEEEKKWHRFNYRATQNKINIGTTALERSVVYTIVTSPKGADGMADSVDTDKTSSSGSKICVQTCLFENFYRKSANSRLRYSLYNQHFKRNRALNHIVWVFVFILMFQLVLEESSYLAWSKITALEVILIRGI